MILKMILLVKYTTHSCIRHRKENNDKVMNMVFVHHYSKGTTFRSAIPLTTRTPSEWTQFFSTRLIE